MIGSLKIHTSPTLDPYRNLSTELWLLRHVREDEMILYLWRNEKTVVIGRNQNAWTEVYVEELEKAGGSLTRRLSGGGAVYHDAGNLNFTFVCSQANSDIRRETSVIVNAARSLGFNAEVTGRNDLCVNGRKFSGHSYYKEGRNCFHNGTVLIRTDSGMMARVLNVNAEKLRSKGVRSVRSRTVNLSEIDPGMNVEQVSSALVAAFEAEYGMKSSPFAITEDKDFDTILSMFSSREWIFGRTTSFSDKLEHRFEWGLVEAELDVRDGIVRDCTVYTDALDISKAAELRQDVIGRTYAEVTGMFRD